MTRLNVSICVMSLVLMTGMLSVFTGSALDQRSSSLIAQETKSVTENVANKPSERFLRDARIRTVLRKQIDLAYDAVPFGDVRDQLSQDLQFDIVIDLNLEGVLDNDTEVSANYRGIRLGDGLRTMLREVDATYIVRNGVLLIVSIDDQHEPEYLVQRMVDADTLLKWIDRSNQDPLGEALEKVAEPVAKPQHLLINTIMNIVQPDSWQVNGTGNGTLECIGGVLVVSNSEEIADHVLAFVQDLEYQFRLRSR